MAGKGINAVSSAISGDGVSPDLLQSMVAQGASAGEPTGTGTVLQGQGAPIDRFEPKGRIRSAFDLTTAGEQNFKRDSLILAGDEFKNASRADQLASNVASKSKTQEQAAGDLAIAGSLFGTGLQAATQIAATNSAERVARENIDFKSGMATKRYNQKLKETANSKRLASESQEIDNIGKLFDTLAQGEGASQLAASGSQRQLF